MKLNLLTILTPTLALSVLLSSCVTTTEKKTIASLNDEKIVIKDEEVDRSLEKAMASYEQFIDESQDTVFTPEAIRRLADMKVQKDYTQLDNDFDEQTSLATEPTAIVNDKQQDALSKENSKVSNTNHNEQTLDSRQANKNTSVIAELNEDEKSFNERATKNINIADIVNNNGSNSVEGLAVQDSIALQEAGAKEAIVLYERLLKTYPLFERNDQVLYQLSRAYEEIGQIEPAMKVMNQLIRQFPNSIHINEAEFRLAEYYFTKKKYLDAEELYGSVIERGEGTDYYELALYKQGWAYFKQDLYEEALHDFIKTLDYMLENGYELENITNKIEKKRIDDTYRVISLSFSYLGGAESVTEYFEKYGHRHYEGSLYSHLAEYYLDKRRYSDSAKTYHAYIENNKDSKESPYFYIRIIEIYKKGGFPKLVVEAKQDFSERFSLESEFWSYNDIKQYPTVLDYLKSNLIDLANHYHALYRDKQHYRQKEDNYQQALFWYRQYFSSFPEDKLAPGLNYQFAEILLEHKDYAAAAKEYEKTAYHYLEHDKSADAGYAAIYAYREQMKRVDQAQRNVTKKEIIRTSLQFSDRFPKNENATVVLAAAVDDLYSLEDYENASIYGRKLINDYPTADQSLLSASWIVVAHASFDSKNYKEAEDAYIKSLTLIDNSDKEYKNLTENLAASIYKQGEDARLLEDYQQAANHFLRVSELAPNSSITATADYDAASALIVIEKWSDVEVILQRFRKRYPKHGLNTEITKKLAVVYKEDNKPVLAAAEFERIEKENPEDAVLRREALTQAAELYEIANQSSKSLRVYKKLVNNFPEPFDETIEIRHKMSEIYLAQGKNKSYITELTKIVSANSKAGKEATDRTQYLAAKASLVLAEPKLDAFNKIKLSRPFKKNLSNKKKRMKAAIDAYSDLVDYQVAEVTAAATYYLAEIYFEFNISLMESERPKNLNAEELEEYELAIEDQAYPFEEKTIKVHEKNMELLDVDVYNEWIDKSIAKLATLVPARYAKNEQQSAVISSIQPLSVNSAAISSDNEISLAASNTNSGM